MPESEPFHTFAGNLWGLIWRFLLPPALIIGVVVIAVTHHNTAAAERLRESKQTEAVESSRKERDREVADAKAAADKQRVADAAASSHRDQEERLLRSCLRSEPAAAETIVLITLDATDLPQWSVSERLAGCLSAIGLKADPHVLTETFYRSKYGSALSAGDVAGTLLSLHLTGKIRGVVIARISSKQSASDKYGFVTTDVTLRLVAYNGHGARIGGTELRASGAAIQPEESMANAVERLFLPNGVVSKLLSLNL